MERRRFLGSGVAATAMMACNSLAQSQEKASETVPIIDVHCHAGHGKNFEKGDAGSDPWTTYNDPQWVLDQASAVGISISVIFPIGNLRYEQANEEIAGYVRRHPDRLIGFAKHDPRTEAGSIRQMLVHEVRQLGLKGLKLHAVPTAEILEVVGELQIPILMHPPSVESCLGVVRDHPQINFILAHLGSFGSKDWREHLRAIEATQKYANLHLDTSSVVFFKYLQEAARRVPEEQLLFGSDGPLVDPRVELYKLRLLEMPKEQEQKVLGGNARRLIG